MVCDGVCVGDSECDGEKEWLTVGDDDSECDLDGEYVNECDLDVVWECDDDLVADPEKEWLSVPLPLSVGVRDSVRDSDVDFVGDRVLELEPVDVRDRVIVAVAVDVFEPVYDAETDNVEERDGLLAGDGEPCSDGGHGKFRSQQNAFSARTSLRGCPAVGRETHRQKWQCNSDR